MGNILDVLNFKKKSWEPIDEMDFPQVLLDNLDSCKVVQGDWHKRVCLTLKNGKYTHISIDTVSMERYPEVFELGNDVPLEDCKLVVLEYHGEPNPKLKVTRTTKLKYIPKNADKEVELDVDNPSVIFASLLS